MLQQLAGVKAALFGEHRLSEPSADFSAQCHNCHVAAAPSLSIHSYTTFAEGRQGMKSDFNTTHVVILSLVVQAMA